MVKRNILSYFLLPISWIYGLIIFLRNKCFDFGILKEEKFNIPVVSVGNINAGGTGKTPHIEYIVRLLKDEYKVAVLSRGYKRKSAGFILADDFSDAETIGDEPCQIKKKFPEIVVAVDNNRRNGINRILDLPVEADVILLDDAYQHRYVKPGLSVLLIDYNKPLSGDFLLPAGRLREPASARKRADIILITKSPAIPGLIERNLLEKHPSKSTSQYLYFTKVAPGEPLPVFKNSKSWDPAEFTFNNNSMLLVSGISKPMDLKQFAMKYSADIRELRFPDHHSFTKENISSILDNFRKLAGDKKVIFTTEKDAMRLQKYTEIPGDIKDLMFYIPIKIEFLNEDSENFNKHIISYVRNNKRNGIFFKGKNEAST